MYYTIEFRKGGVIEPICLIDGIKQIANNWCVDCFGNIPPYHYDEVSAITVHFLNTEHMFPKSAVDEFNNELDKRWEDFKYEMKLAKENRWCK